MRQSVFETKEQYEQFISEWKTWIKSEQKHNTECYHFMLYAMLRGRDWRKCITPPSNPNKLVGVEKWRTLRTNLNIIHNEWYNAELLAPFASAVTPEMLKTLRMTIPKGESFDPSGSTAYKEGN